MSAAVERKNLVVPILENCYVIRPELLGTLVLFHAERVFGYRSAVEKGQAALWAAVTRRRITASACGPFWP